MNKLGVDIDIISFTKNELLLKAEDGSMLKITGDNLKYLTLLPDESYENYTEYEEEYTNKWHIKCENKICFKL